MYLVEKCMRNTSQKHILVSNFNQYPEYWLLTYEARSRKTKFCFTKKLFNIITTLLRRIPFKVVLVAGNTSFTIFLTFLKISWKEEALSSAHIVFTINFPKHF